MIPKILHYILIDPGKFTALNEKCLASWKANLPDYEHRFWTSKDFEHLDYVKAAKNSGANPKHIPVYISIYARLWVLNEVGGFYVDNDAEVVRPPDTNHSMFFGFQRDDQEAGCINDGAMASVKNHPFLIERMKEIEQAGFSMLPAELGPHFLTDQLVRRGLVPNYEEQTLRDDIHIYPKEVLYPWRWDEKRDPSRITERTVSIHHWEGTWVDKSSHESTC